MALSSSILLLPNHKMNIHIMSKNYLHHVLDLLSQLEKVTFRAMFGGYGIYLNGIIFAIIIDEELYFKVDKTNIDMYKKYNSEPFSYTTKNGKKAVMSYWKVPCTVLEDEKKLVEYAKDAHNVSINSKKQ
jgi:DNA transformation protein